MPALTASASGREGTHRWPQLIEGIAEKFAEARSLHPEFEGKTAVYAGLLGSGQYYAEGGSSTRVGILTSLGFVVPEQFTRFFTEVSVEQVRSFDNDLLLWELGDEESRDIIESHPLYQQLEVHLEGRDVFVVDPTLAGGLALISVLSLPYVIDQLVPRLAAAVDGDPATSAN